MDKVQFYVMKLITYSMIYYIWLYRECDLIESRMAKTSNSASNCGWNCAPTVNRSTVQPVSPSSLFPKQLKSIMGSGKGADTQNIQKK